METTLSLRKTVSWLAYPLVMSLTITQYLILESYGYPVQGSSYVSVILGACLVTLLEKFFPHLKEWQGIREDLRVDILYMIVVQVALPVVLGLIMALYLKNTIDNGGIQVTGFWPHHWILGLQVILMLLVADFFRYWLHVASHTYEPLWRLHAVHHSPHKLYWVNVGRFHPVEKTLQYLLDALPFILLGVSEQVLALYFVFYAINGFFQHSNVELRYGPLNYIISSAELHRWHHSWMTRESNANYGNNLIVWDLIFGTRFFPEHRNVEALGLPNRDYPLTFLEQLKAPLLKGMEHKDSPQLSWYDIALNFLIRVRMLRLRFTAWRRMEKATQQPEVVQRDVLMRHVHENQQSQFGHDHQFQDIKDYHDYSKNVPVQTYEMLSPYIERQESGMTSQLTKDSPILYAQTSGTTGTPKFIPLLRRSFYQHKKNQNLLSYIQFREIPQAFSGKLLAIVSPAIEGHLESGTPYGSISGSFYKNLPVYLKAKYVLPAPVFEIEDYETRYLLIVRLAIVQKNITLMASANPSTFLKLLSILQDYRRILLTDVKSDSFCRLNSLPAHLRKAITPHLRCPKSRKSELESVIQHDHITFGDFWPYLQLITTWTGGSCGIALEKLRTALPQQTRVGELGYLSSEFRGSLPIDLKTNQCIPTLTDNFFEFVPKESWEGENPVFLRLHQLQIDQEYYVVVTTPSGLYRYFMNDIVRVTGRFHHTPTIQFIQKGKGVTNITGEKLYESQVIQAIKVAEQELSFSSPFFIVLADVGQSQYHLLIELHDSGMNGLSIVCETLEKHLRVINIEYAQKRASGRLNPLKITTLRPGTGDAYKIYCLEKGQREGQFKTLILQYEQDFHFPYNQYVDDSVVLPS